MTSAQCRAARGLLRLSRQDLAAAAGVGLNTVVRFETDGGPILARNHAALVACFEARGVRFPDAATIAHLPAPAPKILGRPVHDGASATSR